MFADLLTWLKSNNLADNWSDVSGVAVTVLGFLATGVGLFKARNAANLAKEASEQTRESIRRFDTIVDFARAISTLEELKRLHRQKDWHVLPERYSEIRKTLISLRSTRIQLDDQQLSIVQSALANLAALEKLVERALSTGKDLASNKLNERLSEDVDSLIGVLHDLKSESAEVRK